MLSSATSVGLAFRIAKIGRERGKKEKGGGIGVSVFADQNGGGREKISEILTVVAGRKTRGGEGKGGGEKKKGKLLGFLPMTIS